MVLVKVLKFIHSKYHVKVLNRNKKKQAAAAAMYAEASADTQRL